MSKTSRYIGLYVLLSFAVACGGVDTSKNDGQYRIVSPGKSDNYYSDRAKEYEMTGTIPVEMSREEYNDQDKRKKLIEQRLTAVGVYLTAYVTDKLKDMFDNMDYGQFHAMVRNQSYEKEKIIGDAESGYKVKFTIDAAGPKNFDQLLVDAGGDRTMDGVEFGLKMPKGATSDPDGVDRGIPRDFSPSKYDGELETVSLTAKALPTISDSYPYFESFIKDGVYDITMFYGHDYNEERYDIQGAKSMFKTLKRRGFKAPVSSFDQLEHDSGAFTKTIQVKDSPARDICVQRRALAVVNNPKNGEDTLLNRGIPRQTAETIVQTRNGKDGKAGTVDDTFFRSISEIDQTQGVGPDTAQALKKLGQNSCDNKESMDVQIRVRIFHSNMFKTERQYQHNLALTELRKRDVFFYNGHAGPYYGFYLDPNDKAEVTHNEIEEAKLDADRKQLFVAQGCQTYSQYADMLYNNPAKNEENLDVITTVNYSYGEGTEKLFEQLIKTRRTQNGEVHTPVTFYEIVSTLNSHWVNSQRDVFYGVMGLDKNQQVHPYANTDAIGNKCSSDSQCGANSDANLCARASGGSKQCVVKSLGRDCPSGASFGYLGQGRQLSDGICH
jgi:hypothetical protein